MVRPNRWPLGPKVSTDLASLPASPLTKYHSSMEPDEDPEWLESTARKAELAAVSIVGLRFTLPIDRMDEAQACLDLAAKYREKAQAIRERS